MTNILTGQQHSINFTGRQIDTDGIWGPQTQANGIACIQVACNNDYGSGLVVDGIWGPATQAALSGHYVEKGETQYLVTALEILLMLRNYDPMGVECPGTFGDGLRCAVNCYQADNGLAVDGIAGEKTFYALMGVEAVQPSPVEPGEWQKYDPYNLPNFSADEFKCACGCGGDVCGELKCKMQLLRDKLTAHYGCDMPITITSGFRCAYQNEIDGGVPGSLHMSGEACDMQILHDGHYQLEADMIDTIRSLAHQCGMKTGNYYSTGFVHCQIGGSDFYGD